MQKRPTLHFLNLPFQILIKIEFIYNQKHLSIDSACVQINFSNHKPFEEAQYCILLESKTHHILSCRLF